MFSACHIFASFVFVDLIGRVECSFSSFSILAISILLNKGI